MLSVEAQSCEGLLLIEAGSSKRKKSDRPSRSRYETPKVFKNDSRWTYSNMFANVLGSSDVYHMHNFMSTYTVPEYEHYDTPISSNEATFHKKGIAAVVKHWYLHICSSPDYVYNISNTHVRNLTDGSSEVRFMLSFLGTFVYEKPSLQEDDCDWDTSNELETVQERRLASISCNKKAKRKALGDSGVYIIPSNENRIAISQSGSDRQDYLEILNSLVPSSPLPQPMCLRSWGIFTIRLNDERRITSTRFVSEGLVVYPTNQCQL